MAAATPLPTPEVKRLSEAERIADMFIAPSKTFNDLRRSAAWLGPISGTGGHVVGLRRHGRSGDNVS